ncbi:hypothetical protein [Hymenobacter crusticola]|uniref:DUF4890 domain-containing protein n=1 Tax=Hymenobacter crusticola TaxID=1770526 RepID=A0A243WHV0_9BACT|nr:hypothetical protein [Hymenobacter crusticola]OUJ74589.1 hypothetical protein BXP70_07375 [Hymenobacter crusticola]
MKALFLTLALLVALVSSAAAQMNDWRAERAVSSAPPAETVDALTRQMANKLHLNEGQYVQLRAVNQTKLTAIEEIEWQYTDIIKRNAKLNELEGQYEAECSRILTPNQLSLYHDEFLRDTKPSKTASKENGVG